MNSSSVASPEATSAAPSAASSRLFSWHLACLLLVLVFFGAIRWRLADTPLERDEGEYAYAGQLMLQGIPPYKLAYNMKLPGTYVAYAVVMSALGETPRGIHLGLLVAVAGATALMYVLALEFLGPWASLAAAATYALLSTIPATLGLAGHATHFVVFAAIPALILLVRAEKRDNLWILFCSGLLFGLAFVMKQPGVFFGVFGFLYVIYFSLRDRTNWKSLAIRAGIFSAGCTLPFLLTCLIMWRTGVFGNFWFWTFSYARQYSGLVSLRDGWDLFTYHFTQIFAAAPGLWLLTLLGIAALFLHSPIRKQTIFVLGLLLLSGLAVSSGLYFRFHYFLMALPAVALLAGIAIESASQILRDKKLWLRAVPAVIFIAAGVWGIAVNSAYYFRMSPLQACRTTYGMNEGFPEAEQIADYLRQNTTQGDRVFVLGSEPEIYFYSGRLSATGYIYAYPLMENQPYWQKMQEQMIAEVESNRPAYLVYFNNPSSWLTTVGSSRLVPFLNWATSYVKANYREVGLVELKEPEPNFLWGDAAKGVHSQGNSVITIFKRND